MSAKIRIKYNQENYVLYEDKMHKVLECLKSGYTLLDISTNLEIEVMWFEVKPILITKKILLNCAFIYEEGFFIKDGIAFEELEDNRLMIDGLGFNTFKDDFENNVISFIHELQNLWVSLNKLELQVTI